MPSEMQASKLVKGDIVFFAPRKRDDMSVFPELAAYVSTTAYRPHTDKPWYHVAVASGPGSIVDFAPAPHGPDPVLPWATHLDSRSITNDDKTILNVLRLPRRAAAHKLADAIGAMKGQKYTEAGLLTFAAASQARLFQAGTAREQLYTFAAGFEKLTGDTDGYTCVTAVTSAIIDSGVLDQPLIVAEPAPPTTPIDDDALTQSITALYEFLTPATPHLPVVVAAAKRRTAASVAPTTSYSTAVSWDDVDLGYGRVIVALAPGNVVTYTQEYIYALIQAMLDMHAEKHYSLDDVLAAGANLRSQGWPTPKSPAVSPAMLYDALLAAGASEVH